MLPAKYQSEVTVQSEDPCAQEPIHRPGAIQPHGLLVGLDALTLGMITKSDNVDDVFPGTPFFELPAWLPPVVVAMCRDLASGNRPETTLLAEIPGIGTTEVHGFAAAGIVFCEFELPFGVPAHPAVEGASLMVAETIKEMDSAGDVAGLAALTARAVRAISGFERVLVYRFDAEGDGEVLGESLVADWPQSFLGFRFPASDIPVQARALYRLTDSRWFPCRDYEAVPLVPDRDTEGRPLDISLSRYRSVSPVHRLYQKNIGVDGAMSVSVMRDGELWGLVIGHHRQFHRVPAETRHHMIALSRSFAMRLDALLEQKAYHAVIGNMRACTAMLRKLAAVDDFLVALTEDDPSILDMLPDCKGAAVVWDVRDRSDVRTRGEVPPADDLVALTFWLRSVAETPVFATDRLSDRYPPFLAHRETASGLLAIFFEDSRHPVLLLFRPEIVQTVSWAGRPEKIVGTDGTPNLPRQSFDRWTEIKRGQSQSWQSWELDIATTICSTVNGVIVRQTRRIQALDVEVGRFTQALALSGTTLYHQDVDLRYLWVHNPHLHGARTIIGLTDWDIFEPDLASRVVAVKRRVLATGLGERITIPSALDYPLAEWFDLSIEPMTRDGSGIVGLSCAVVGITERKRAEALALQYGNHLQMVLKAIPDVVWKKNKQGRYTFSSHRFGLIVGKAPSEVVGKDDFDLFDSELATFFLNRDQEAVAAGKPTANEEWVTYAHDGARVLLETVRTPVYSDDGVFAGVLGIGREITLLKEAERAALEASQAKGAFLANMSHEIRTPMNGVLGLTHLMMGTSLTARQRDYLTKIEMSATALLDVINDILDLSKIEAGKVAIEAIEFGLDGVLDHVCNVMAARMAEKEIDLLFHIDPAVPKTVVGDPARLRQVLLNLTGNAIKFTERGEVVLSIRVADRAEGSVSLIFSVRDTGIGMTGEQQEILFRDFSQADESISRRFGGTGLGLSISKRLVEMMGGAIGVKSEAGHGSTFSVTLPFTCDPDAPECIALPPRLRDLRVLVVDDNPIACLVEADILIGWSMRVETASSGQSAITKVERAGARGQPFDLVVMDWRMPGLDGLQTARIILENDRLSRRPALIMVTGFSKEDLVSQAGAIGVSAVLSKPFTPSRLFECMASLFGAGGLPPAPRPADASPVLGPATSRLRGVRVLVAEDNAVNRQIAVELLARAGMIVDVAENGREAADRVLSGGTTYDAVLMDVQMPVMDGLAATDLIRRQYQRGVLPIIAMTAHAMEHERQRCLDAGMNDHVAKPVDPRLLYETLERWVVPRDLVPAGMAAQISEGGAGAIADADIDMLFEEPAAAVHVAILPEELPPFDLVRALDRVGGDPDLLKRLIISFRDSFAQADAEMGRLIEELDIEGAFQLAHAIKGAAGALEAVSLFLAARDLEQALRPTSLGILHATFDEALAETMAAAATLVDDVVQEKTCLPISEGLWNARSDR